MKILLTGATGFIGSHILDHMRARGLPVRLLLRATSDRRFIAPHLSHVECCEGSVESLESLRAAMPGVTHVIHCAGVTTARYLGDYHRVNCDGTRNLVLAANDGPAEVRRLILLSSLAAAHPATAAAPAREEDRPDPVSEYGRSKLAAEQEIRANCKVPFTILRPPPVYGPRDYAFIKLFRTIRRHIVPLPGGGRQPLSMVFAKDLAGATVMCLTHPAAEGKTYFVASPEIVTVRQLAAEIARQLEVWTIPLWLPTPLLWPVCAVSEAACSLVGKPSLLNRHKYPELCAPGWVCDATRLRKETGFEAFTPFTEGIKQTVAWFRTNCCA